MMQRIRPSFRLAISLAWLSLTGVMAAQWLGVLPDGRTRAVTQRIALCENLAVNCSLFLASENLDALQVSLDELKRRNHEIRSATVRRDDGEVFANAGVLLASGSLPSARSSTENHVYVPLLQGEARWGELEVQFEPLSQTWFFGIVDRNWAQALVLIGTINLVLFGFMLWRVLYELDPSKTAPSRVRAAFDSLTEGLLVLDNQGRIAMANEAFSSAIALPQKNLIGRVAAELEFLPNKEDAPGWSEMSTTQSEVHRVEMTYRLAEGDIRTFMVNASPILEADGGRRGVLATFDDITELASRSRELVYMLDVVRDSRDKIKQQNDELRFLATRDSLTGCLNRRAFFELFDAAWSDLPNHRGQIAVLMVDIDRFKAINDTNGHSVGDEVLRQVAAALQAASKDRGVVCRFGGEEFAVLLKDMTAEDSKDHAEHMRARIHELQIDELRVSASFGVSHAECGARTPQELLEQADKALYFSKRTGRDRVTRFDRLPTDFSMEGGSHAAEASRGNAAEESIKVPYHAVSSLLSALAFRDPETAAHSMRVADLAVATARGLMSAGDAYLLEIGALLHDVGKIGVPDAVLLKPGSLTKEEWEVMQTHDRIGVEIVSASFTCFELTEIIRCHHAWYGEARQEGGLPTGDEIPIRARLIAIADAYDAMTSDRVYRKGRPMEQAFAELRKMAGRQFDPALVERFIETVGRRAPRKEENAAVDKEVTLNLCLQTERMAKAVDDRDFNSIRALAKRLEMTAAKCDLSVLSDLAKEISAAADEPDDLPQIVELVHDLLELCLATQKSCLARDRQMSVRGH